MAHRRFFQSAGASLLYSGTRNLNPILPKGGTLLLSGATKSAALEPFRNPKKMLEHVAVGGDDVVCLTSDIAIATAFAKDGGYGANDLEASYSHQPPSVVLIIETENLVYLHVKSVLTRSFYELRVNKEIESIAPIVMPTDVKKLLINDMTLENPLYISPFDTRTKHLIVQLETSYLEMLKANIDLNNPKAAEAYGNYLAILTELCGGPREFKEKIQALKDSIKATGYALDPAALTMLNAAIKSVKNPFLPR